MIDDGVTSNPFSAERVFTPSNHNNNSNIVHSHCVRVSVSARVYNMRLVVYRYYYYYFIVRLILMYCITEKRDEGLTM